MDRWGLIVVVGVLTYATRLSGFLLGRRSIPPLVERFLTYVPAAVFAALVAPDLGIGTVQTWPRLLGVLAAALVLLRWKQLWAGVGSGMVVYWLARRLLEHGLHGSLPITFHPFL